MRPPLPPFTQQTALQKVRAAEDAWNRRDPEATALAYSEDSRWRNRDLFLVGRRQIVSFLSEKWAAEREYRLIKELFAFSNDRIAVRFAYEYQNAEGSWLRAYGNENWVFDANGLMAIRHASINDVSIRADERKFHWPLGERPADHPGLSDLGL